MRCFPPSVDACGKQRLVLRCAGRGALALHEALRSLGKTVVLLGSDRIVKTPFLWCPLGTAPT